MGGDKPWQRSSGGRRRDNRPRRRVVIVCEDEKSARFYFESFPIDRTRAEVIAVGTGMNTDSLVQHAIDLVSQAERDGIPYGDVWCVFDRDSFPESNFARAFELARAHRLHIAWSNEAFELWYLLHFNYHDTAIPRHEYAKKLAPHFRYDKADRSIYGRLKDHQPAALRNARRLERYWAEMDEPRPERSNPSTRVHKLVEILNDLADLELT
jgi:hypothetical protein